MQPVAASLATLHVETLDGGPDGDTWLATPEGSLRMRDEELTSASLHDPASPGRVTAMRLSADGQMWLGSEGGTLSRFNTQELVTLTLPGAEAVDVRSILEDRTGTLWFGTRQGVSIFDVGIFLGLTPENAPGLRDVWSILQDRSGAMWFGSWAGGAFRYANGQFEVLAFGTGLPHNDVRALHEDRDGNRGEGTTFTVGVPATWSASR